MLGLRAVAYQRSTIARPVVVSRAGLDWKSRRDSRYHCCCNTPLFADATIAGISVDQKQNSIRKGFRQTPCGRRNGSEARNTLLWQTILLSCIPAIAGVIAVVVAVRVIAPRRSVTWYVFGVFGIIVLLVIAALLSSAVWVRLCRRSRNDDEPR